MNRSNQYVPPHGRNVRCKVALDRRSLHELVLDWMRFRMLQPGSQHCDEVISTVCHNPAHHPNSPLNRDPVDLRGLSCRSAVSSLAKLQRIRALRQI